MIHETKDNSLDSLKERAKELESLYRVDEALIQDSLPEILTEICRVLPRGFCNVSACTVMISLDNALYTAKPAPETISDEIRSNIVVNERVRGHIRAVYSEDVKNMAVTSFLTEEEKLLNTIAVKISNRILYEEFEAV
jgi:hypothetical protein